MMGAAAMVDWRRVYRLRNMPKVEPLPWDENEVFGEDGIPIVECIRYDPKGFLKFWCRYCKMWHYHGKGDGPRAAHCFYVDSPYCKGGVFLRENPEKSEV